MSHASASVMLPGQRDFLELACDKERDFSLFIHV